MPAMATRKEENPEVGVVESTVPVSKPRDWTILSLRFIALMATASATLVMALNTHTKNLVVANVGSTPIGVTLTAKFSHTPAFVFFVIVNGMATVHNLMMIAVNIFSHPFEEKGLRLPVTAILDMMTVALTSCGDGAATFMAQLGRKGNSHARWGKICDKFEAYCNQGGGALVASFIGIILLIVITVMSIIKLRNSNPYTN